MQILLELLIAGLMFIGFITNALPQTPFSAGSMVVDALYIALGLVAVRTLDREQIRRWKVPLVLFGLFALWCLGQVFWGPGISLGQKVMGFRNNVVYPGIWVLLAISSVKLNRRRLMEEIWWLGLIICSFAIVQGVFHHELPDSLVLLSRTADGRFGFEGEDILRVTGLVGNTIVFTGLSAIVLLIGWMRPERESTYLHKILEIIPAVALYMTYTRAANVTILLVWGFAWSFFRMKRWWCGILRYCAVLIVLSIILSGDAGGAPQSKIVRLLKTNCPQTEFVLNRMSGQEVTSQKSSSWHFEMYRLSWELFKKDPICGTGIGSQGYSSREPREIGVMTDGYWAATALETGIPGAVLWIAFLSWVAWYLFTFAWQSRFATDAPSRLSHRLAVTLLLLFAYFSIASTLNSSYSARTSQCFIWMILGLLLMDREKAHVL